jgi:hypothetical protein
MQTLRGVMVSVPHEATIRGAGWGYFEPVQTIDVGKTKRYSSPMRVGIRSVGVLVVLACSAPAGINWRTVWLEPNPLVFSAPGFSISYVVYGIDGMDDVHHDLTRNPSLKVTSSDETIVAVDQTSARVIAKAAGRAEIRVAFSECTSIINATVPPAR